MAKVTSGQFQREFGRYRAVAHRKAVTITNHGREDVVLVSAEEYARLRSLDRQAFYAWELPEEIVQELGSVAIPEDADRFDAEYEP